MNQDKNELFLGLRNALEHGENLQKAKQSFINAGYNLREVEQAVNQMSQPPSPSQPPPKPQQPPQQISQTIPEKTIKSNKKLILLVIISALALISALLIIFFWDKIKGLFS